MRHRQWRKRLAKLDVILPQAPTVDVQERQKRRRQVVRRLVRLCEQACELMIEGEQISVAEGFRQWAEAERGPYAWWFRDLFQGRCRLPELAPATMKELLVAWLSPDCDHMTRVCRGCGLLYPHPRVPPRTEWKLLPGKVPRVGPPPWYDLPVIFPSCPGCGASPNDIDWSHLVDRLDRPWMALDGYVGFPIRTVSVIYGLDGRKPLQKRRTASAGDLTP
jgi:hypothetical protein